MNPSFPFSRKIGVLKIGISNLCEEDIFVPLFKPNLNEEDNRVGRPKRGPNKLSTQREKKESHHKQSVSKMMRQTAAALYNSTPVHITTVRNKIHFQMWISVILIDLNSFAKVMLVITGAGGKCICHNSLFNIRKSITCLSRMFWVCEVS